MPCRARKFGSRFGAGRTTGSRRRWSSCAAKARSGSCRAARTSASAAAARCSTCTSRRRSQPSSARSRTRSGISARSGPSACCGRSRARPGTIASAPACRCAMSSRRARSWSASMSASRASLPRSEAATSCRSDVSDLLLPLRDLIGAMATRDRLPQIELAVGDDCTALVLRHLEPLGQVDLALLREFASRHGVEWWLQPKGPDTAQPLDGSESSLAYTLPEFGDPDAVSGRPTSPRSTTRSTRRWSRARCACSPSAADERVIDWFCGLGNFTLPMARQARARPRHRRQRGAARPGARRRRGTQRSCRQGDVRGAQPVRAGVRRSCRRSAAPRNG